MGTYLLCSNPIHGHAVPVTVLGEHLASRGHRVVLLTGSRFEERARAAGLGFVALPPGADYDDRDVDSYLPDRGDRTGIALAQYDIQTIFVRPIPAQAAAVDAAIADLAPDALLVDGTFGGVVPMLLGPRDRRPPILGLGLNPLAQSSRDVAPTGTGLAPSSTPVGRLRNRALWFVATRVLFRQTQQLGRRVIAEVTGPDGPRLDRPIMDVSRLFDRFLQLCAAEFEYPRGDLDPDTVFVGGLPVRPGEVAEPDWWDDLDAGRPIVHVTQGTIDNRDVGRLLRPTVEALADRDVLVVVTTGGRDPAALGPLPANARVAAYLPYDRLLPRTDVMLTNGGYGGVQQALAAGVPLVVAGDTEDKPEVAARVRWSGVGVDLRTGRPTPTAIVAAVDDVLGDPSYRDRARRMADTMRSYDAFATVEDELARAAST